MAKTRLRARNATAVYMHMTPELLKTLKVKLQVLGMKSVEMKVPSFRNQHKKSVMDIKVGGGSIANPTGVRHSIRLKGKLSYPSLIKEGSSFDAYWTFYLDTWRW